MTLKPERFPIDKTDEWEARQDAHRQATLKPEQIPEDSVDEIVSTLYRRFKEWSRRGFGPEDVTWCEVKADVLKLINVRLAALSKPVTDEEWRSYSVMASEDEGRHYNRMMDRENLDAFFASRLTPGGSEGDSIDNGAAAPAGGK